MFGIFGSNLLRKSVPFNFYANNSIRMIYNIVICFCPRFLMYLQTKPSMQTSSVKFLFAILPLIPSHFSGVNEKMYAETVFCALMKYDIMLLLRSGI